MPTAKAVTVEVYVPCGVTHPFMDTRDKFEAANPAIRVSPRIENTNVLVQRILDGATPDVFLALGDVEVQRLEKAGRAEASDARPIAGNYVGLLVPAANPGKIKSLSDLGKASSGSLCIADPQENSSGRHLQQALEAQGVWKELQPRLVPTKFPSDVQTNVASGKVNAGAIYGPCFMENSEKGGRPAAGQAKGKVMYLLTVPPELAGEFALSAVLVKGAANREAALKFVEFIAAPENRQAWEQWGFDPLPSGK